MRTLKSFKTISLILTLVSISIIAYAQDVTLTTDPESPISVGVPPFEDKTYDLYLSYPSDLDISSVELDLKYTPAYIEWTNVEIGDAFSGWTTQIDMDEFTITLTNFVGSVTIGPTPTKLATITFKSTDDAEVTLVNASLEGTNQVAEAIVFTPVPITTEGHDLSLPVELSMFRAVRYPDGIEVLWEAESQRENLGWNLYRSESKDGEFERINTKVIEGDGTTAVAKTYKFVDNDAKRGKPYSYYLESISFDGETEKSDIVEVKLVKTSLPWGAIKQLGLHR